MPCIPPVLWSQHAYHRAPLDSASVLGLTMGKMITRAISVHAYGSHRLCSSASLRQADWWLLYLCLFFFLVPYKATEKQIISLSTQIIREKPQTVSGPLWVIIHPTVVLTLLVVSCTIWNSDLGSLALPYGIIALRKAGGGPPSHIFPSSLPIGLRPTSLSEWLQFLHYTFRVVLTPLPGGGGGRMGERETDSFFICPPVLLRYDWYMICKLKVYDILVWYIYILQADYYYGVTLYLHHVT